jgi:hypothetical protein
LKRETAVGPAGTNASSGRKFAGVGIVVGAGVDVVISVTSTVVVTTLVRFVAVGVTVTVVREVYVMLIWFVVVS